MKRNYINKTFLFCLITVFLPLATSAAEPSYTFLEPIKAEVLPVTAASLSAYIKSAYWYVLGITIASSVLMLVIGGVQYTLTWADEGQKGRARSRIENALIGLLIALTGYLILYTINPKLTLIEIQDVEKACKAVKAITGGGAMAGTSGGPSGGGDSKPATSDPVESKESYMKRTGTTEAQYQKIQSILDKLSGPPTEELRAQRQAALNQLEAEQQDTHYWGSFYEFP